MSSERSCGQIAAIKRARVQELCNITLVTTLTVDFLADTIERGDTRTVVVGVRSLLLRRGGSPGGGLLPSRVDTMVFYAGTGTTQVTAVYLEHQRFDIRTVHQYDMKAWVVSFFRSTHGKSGYICSKKQGGGRKEKMSPCWRWRFSVLEKQSGVKIQ
jgi:hypothetical protein